MSVLTKLFKGGLLLSAANLLVRVSGLLVLVPLARILGPTHLGIYSLVFWLVQSSSALGRLGIDVAMHRNGAKLYRTDPVATGRLLGVGSTLMGIAFTAITAAVWIWRSPLAEHWLGNAGAAEWMGYAAVLLFIEGIGLILMTSLLSLHSFKAHSLVTVIGALGRLMLSPFLAWYYGLLGAFVGLIVASFLQLGAAVITFRRSLKLYDISLQLRGFWQESYQIFRFGLPFYAGNALINLLFLPMMGTVGRLAGLEALGQLRIGQALSQIVGFLPNAVAPVAISVLSEAYGQEEQDFQKLQSVHLRFNWLLALIFATFLNLAVSPLIYLLFGKAYEGAVPLAIGMAWWAMLTVVVDSFNISSVATGSTYLIALSSFIQKIIFISLTFILIPSQGAMGFILGLIAGTLIQFSILLVFFWRKLQSLLKRQILILGVFSLVSIGLNLLVNYWNFAPGVLEITTIPITLLFGSLCTWSILSSTELERLIHKVRYYLYKKFPDK
ncbi:MAG: oligosaccharide flippase family protein [Coleofasciculaceae cyanobacterium]